MSTEYKKGLSLPLSKELIEKYKELGAKDRRNLGLLFASQIGAEPKSLRNLIAYPDKFQPSLEERRFLTKEITYRWRAANEPGFVEDEIEQERRSLEKSEDRVRYEKWRNKELGKNAKAMQSY
jgi:hypothetical protein